MVWKYIETICISPKKMIYIIARLRDILWFGGWYPTLAKFGVFVPRKLLLQNRYFSYVFHISSLMMILIKNICILDRICVSFSLQCNTFIPHSCHLHYKHYIENNFNICCPLLSLSQGNCASTANLSKKLSDIHTSTHTHTLTNVHERVYMCLAFLAVFCTHLLIGFGFGCNLHGLCIGQETFSRHWKLANLPRVKVLAAYQNFN